MTTIEGVQAELNADSSGFVKGVNQARDSLGKFTSDADKLSSLLQSFGFGPKFAANFVAVDDALQKVGKSLGVMSVALAGVGYLIANAGSDFEQTGGLIERVFADGASEVEAFALVTSKEMGLSLQETRQGLVSLGAQLKNTLGDTAAAEKQSKALVTLAADISAAMNVPFEDTIARLQSGLRGEANAVEKLNIFISESALKQQALAQGITKSTETMTEQEKVGLRLAAIFKQTADIVGANAAEAAGFQGQMARLQGSVKDVAAQFGTAFLPVATSVVSVMRDLVGFFAELSDGTKQAIVFLGIAASAFGALAFAMSFVGTSIISINATMVLFGGTIGTLAVAMGQAALAAGVFVIAYEATTALLKAMGANTVPKNVSVMNEFSDAVSMAARGGNDLLRVLLNVASALLKVSAVTVLVGTVGIVDLTKTVDDLNEHFQEMIDNAEDIGGVATQFETTTKAMDDARKAADGFSEEIDVNGQSLGDTSASALTAAQSIQLLKTRQDAAKAAAKLHTKALEDQAKAFEKLNALAEDLGKLAEKPILITAGMTSAVDKFSERLSKAAELGAATPGVGASAAVSGIESAAIKVFLREFGDALVAVPTDKFSDSMAQADELLGAMGLRIADVTDAVPELGERIDGLGTVVGDTQIAFEEANKAIEASATTMSATLAGGLVGAATGSAGLNAVGGVVGGTAGAVVDTLSGGATAGLGTVVGGIFGTVLGGALDKLVGVLGVVSPLMDGLGVAIGFLSPAMEKVKGVFGALGKVLVALGPAIGSLADIIVLLAVPITRVIEAFALIVRAGTDLFLFITAGFGFVKHAFTVFDQAVLLPAVNAMNTFANGLVHLANSFIDFIRAMPGNENFGTKLQELDVGTLDSSLGLLEGAGGRFSSELRAAVGGPVVLAEAATEAAKGLEAMNEELRNAPSDFKIAAYRFAAQSVSDPGMQTIQAGYSSQAGIYIANLNVQANDANNLIAQIQAMKNAKSIRTRGTAFTEGPDYSGRGE